MNFRSVLFAAIIVSACGALLHPTQLEAQPSLSVSIDIPPVSVDQATESYVPSPIPVTVTIYNTGTTASQALSARISFAPDLALDVSELDATIKTPVPAAVQPNDSAKVQWLLTHPPAFAMTNYRVRIWLTYTAVDSFETQKLFLLPAMERPDFKMTFGPVPALQVRADSLGYQQNPFTVLMRLSNQGGTTVDSVASHIILPPDYVLDPLSQNNPQNYALPIPPPQAGNPRIELSWTVRYVGATRQPRTDTLRFRTTGRDAAGGLVQKDTLLLISVDGLSPKYSIAFFDPGSMAYDAATIYQPQPYPLQLRITNLSEQWIDLAGLTLQLQGDGIATADPLTRTIPLMLEGGHLDFTWNVTAERRHAPRQMTAVVEVADGDGLLQGRTHLVGIPGQPYALTVQDYQAPDTLAVNAEGTAFLSNAIPLSFRVRNDTWYNGTVTATRVQSQGQGLIGAPFHDRTHALALQPGEESAVIADTFHVEGQVDSRLVAFHVMAVSDRGDTARASRPVFVPGLRPVLRMQRRGPDAIVPDMLGGYVPNPMAQDYILHNDGSIDVRIDSVVLRYAMDGVVTPEPLRRDYGWTLRPGDSLLTRWNFSIYPRDTLRDVPMTATAYVSGRFEASAPHALRIDALRPDIAAAVLGPDTLAYDPATLYAPNPFTKTLRIRNSGTGLLRLDSIVLRYADPLITPLDALEWTSGRVLKPDSVLELSWRLQAEKHEQATLLPLTFAVYHGGGTRSDIAASVFLPALVPGLETEFTGDAQLQFDPTSIYRPDPFVKSLRLRNSGTADLQLDSIVVSWSDAGITSIEAARRDVGQIVGAGATREYSWNFRTAPHASAGYVALRFTLYHSGGTPYPVSSDIYIPGEPFAFRIADAAVPDRVDPRSDGQGYENNPVPVRYAIVNDAWFSTSLKSATVELDGEGVQMLSPQPRPGNLLFAERERSPVLRDSFFVLPASIDRSVTVRIRIENAQGSEDMQEFSVFIPRIATNAADAPPSPAVFRVHGLYPNPLAAGSRLQLDVEHLGVLRLEVVDRLGRMLWRSEAADLNGMRRQLPLDLPTLRQGLYYLRVQDGGARTTLPFVVLP